MYLCVVFTYECRRPFYYLLCFCHFPTLGSMGCVSPTVEIPKTRPDL